MKATEYIAKIQKLIDESGDPNIEVMTIWWNWDYTGPDEPYLSAKKDAIDDSGKAHYDKDCIMLDNYRGGS